VRRPLLLLPRALDSFVLGDHARQLIDASGGAGVLPGRVPYGALVRTPAAMRSGVAATIARSISRAIPRDWTPDETVLIAYHAIQWPAARAMLARGAAAELWYCRWDRYEAAHDAGPEHRLLVDWHREMAEASTLTFAVSGKLAELEHEAGRQAIVVGLSADSFPSEPLEPGGRGAELVAHAQNVSIVPKALGVHEGQAVGNGGAGGAAVNGPSAGNGGGAGDSVASSAGVGDAAATSLAAAPIAVSLGHLGRRTDWRLLRAVVDRMPDLQLLLIGAWHENEVEDPDDYRWLRSSGQVVWLGKLDDADAAAVIAQADVGIVPFTVDPFNDAGLPTRILKYARLGRPTISPPLAGSRTWARATTFADGPSDFVSALRDAAGLRNAPDLELRAWALDQTAAAMNAPLLERLAE
jgi:glycosyltransferase involved in cell wall biosynthesis